MVEIRQKIESLRELLPRLENFESERLIELEKFVEEGEDICTKIDKIKLFFSEKPTKINREKNSLGSLVVEDIPALIPLVTEVQKKIVIFKVKLEPLLSLFDLFEKFSEITSELQKTQSMITDIDTGPLGYRNDINDKMIKTTNLYYYEADDFSNLLDLSIKMLSFLGLNQEISRYKQSFSDKISHEIHALMQLFIKIWERILPNMLFNSPPHLFKITRNHLVTFTQLTQKIRFFTLNSNLSDLLSKSVEGFKFIEKSFQTRPIKKIPLKESVFTWKGMDDLAKFFRLYYESCPN